MWVALAQLSLTFVLLLLSGYLVWSRSSWRASVEAWMERIERRIITLEQGSGLSESDKETARQLASEAERLRRAINGHE